MEVEIKKVQHTTHRYPPWLEKAMATQKHSKSTWIKDQKQGNANQKKEQHVQKEEEQYDNVWSASRAGNAIQVQRMIENKGIDIMAHNDKEGGETVLHIACWHGHLDLVRFIIDYSGKKMGSNVQKQLINTIDTCYYRSSSLIEACRNNQVRFKLYFIYYIDIDIENRVF